MDVFGKPLSTPNEYHYDLVCLKKDEPLGLITLYVELDLVHHTNNNISANQIWGTFQTLFGVVNTIQVNQLEIELSNFKMV